MQLLGLLCQTSWGASGQGLIWISPCLSLVLVWCFKSSAWVSDRFHSVPARRDKTSAFSQKSAMSTNREPWALQTLSWCSTVKEGGSGCLHARAWEGRRNSGFSWHDLHLSVTASCRGAVLSAGSASWDSVLFLSCLQNPFSLRRNAENPPCASAVFGNSMKESLQGISDWRQWERLLWMCCSLSG